MGSFLLGFIVFPVLAALVIKGIVTYEEWQSAREAKNKYYKRCEWCGTYVLRNKPKYD